MKDVLRNVQHFCLIFLFSQSFVKCDEGLPGDHEHERESEVDRIVTDVAEYGFTTLCYEDIPPMSIDVDGAPGVGPVVYGSAGDLEDSEHNPTDDEVKRLREEFFKKHRQQTGEPAQNQHKDNVKNIGKHENLHGTDNEAAVKCERVQKTLGELYNKLNAAHDLMNEDLNENNIKKQHWNTQDDIHAKHDHLHQHWNGEKLNQKNIQGQQEWTVFPKEPGHRNDDLQRKFHDAIYDDPNPDVDAIKKNDINLKKNDKSDLKMNRNIQINLKQFQDEEKDIKHNANNVDAIKINEIHLKKGDKTDLKMEGNIQINLKKLQKVKHLKHQFKNLLNLKEKLDSKDNLKLYRKMMDVELRETTNPHQHDELHGPGCELKKKSNDKLRNILKNNEKILKHKRGKRNVISTKRRRRSGSNKTTEIYWDVDGRFRDISVVERERNEFDDAEANTTQPFWIHDDGHRPKTAKKFRPRPPLRYNRCPKEPLDYGSYDKSEYWRYMTELVTGATFPKDWYDIMPTPKEPSTKEVFEMCRENYTTSECFQYPDISRLRDTKERRFMKKYYKRKYSDLESEEEEQ